jgi:hypothetical protein
MKKKIVFLYKESKADKDFEDKINLFALIAVISLLAFMFLFFITTHLYNENNNARISLDKCIYDNAHAPKFETITATIYSSEVPIK